MKAIYICFEGILNRLVHIKSNKNVQSELHKDLNVGSIHLEETLKIKILVTFMKKMCIDNSYVKLLSFTDKESVIQLLTRLIRLCYMNL